MKSSPFLLAAALFLAALTPRVESQVILYRETFSSTANNENLNSFGWGVHYGSSGTAYTNAGMTNSAGASNFAGKPSDLSNVNAGPMNIAANSSGSQTSTGFVFISPTSAPFTGGTNAPILAWTNEFTSPSLTTSTLTEISFFLGSATTQSIFRPAVQVGGTWYVSNTTFGNSAAVSSAANFSTGAELKTLAFDPAAPNWSTLSFVQSGSNPLSTNGTGSLALGSTAASNLDGSITAFGLYAGAGATGTIRFDTYTLSVVPEPGSLVMMLTGVSVLLSFRRARRGGAAAS